MSDIGRFTCEQLREDGPELALGVLPARERATAVAHLQDCPNCCEYVRELALTADGLLDLIPGTEPPMGFEDRVLRRIGVTSGARERRHALRCRVTLVAAAVVAAFAVGLGGWAIGGSPDHATSGTTEPASAGSHALLTASLTATGGHPIGQAFAYPGASPWVYMSVDAEEAGVSGTVRCLLQLSDGSTVALGSFHLADGYGHWGGPYPAAPASVTGVQLLAHDGSVVASATFPRTATTTQPSGNAAIR
jgi:hypothetical protein